MVLLTMKPTIMGVSPAPAPGADVPPTACTKSGRYMVAPYMPPPTRKVATTETAKMRLWNKPGLMIGSAARFSMIKNPTHPAADQASSPTTGGDDHAYSDPAHEKASSRGTAASTSAATPA